MNATPTEAAQETLANVPGVGMPELRALVPAKAPSFASLMGSFRAEHESEVQAASALLIAPATLSAYCSGASLPTDPGIRRLAPSLGLSVHELADLVEAQRAAMQRGESIATVAPIRTRIRRLPVATSGEGA